MITLLVSIVLLLLLLPHALPRFLALYDSLREHPKPPKAGSLLSRVLYRLHKGYFRYLMDGPGYVLGREERLVFDTFVLILLTAVAYGAFLAFKTLVAALAHVALDVCVQSGVSLNIWGRMARKAYRIHLHNGGGNASVENCHVGPGMWIAEVKNEMGGCSPFAIA